MSKVCHKLNNIVHQHKWRHTIYIYPNILIDSNYKMIKYLFKNYNFSSFNFFIKIKTKYLKYLDKYQYKLLNLIYCRGIIDKHIKYMQNIQTRNLTHKRITDNNLEYLKQCKSINLSYCKK